MSTLDQPIGNSHTPAKLIAGDIAIVALTAVLMAACGDDVGQVTSPIPRAPAEFLASNSPHGNPPPPNIAAGLVFCDLAVLAPSGKYRVRTVPIKVPNHAIDPKQKTVKFGFRGWASGTPDPTRLAACQIPNTLAALQFFKTAFNVGSSPQPLVAQSVKDLLSGAQAASAMSTDQAAMVYDGDGGSCDPLSIVDYGCGCVGETCSGWDDGGTVQEGPAPAESPVTNLFYDSSAEPGYYLPPIYCYGQTDLPHVSRTVYSNVNVHGRTSCGVPLPISVGVVLQKEKSFWFFYWWSTLGYNFYANIATLAQTNAAAVCSKGWWRGRSAHTIAFPLGYLPPAVAFSTSNYNYIAYC
jgi:hypothetical protein